MKVFFSCSVKNISKFKDYYLKTREIILQNKFSLTRDWIIDSIKRDLNGEKEPSRSKIYQTIMDSLKNADISIFDTTVPGMSLGYQIAYSLEKGKPTLLINKSGQESFNNYFIAGCKSGFLTLKSYDNELELEKIVKSFLIKYKDSSKFRFNLVLDKYQNDFIEEISFKNKKTKTEIIKEAIDEKINKKDAA